MDFEKRLQKAIQRGRHEREESGRSAAERAESLESQRNLHSKYRLELSEHIEKCLSQLADHFPGFRFQTLISDEGWGARISRDDVSVQRGRGAANVYSRMEMVVEPFGEARIIAIRAKGTIRNKEVLTRSHFQLLDEADMESFSELIDLWVLEYAERFAAG